MRILSSLLSCATVVALGCSSGDPASDSPDATPVPDDASVADAAPPTPDAAPSVDPSGDDTQYVVSAIDVPTTAAEASALGLDIDFDVNMRPDNALGNILSSLGTMGGNDPQAFMDAQIANGTIIHLSNIKATSLTQASGVGFSLFIGEDGDIPDNPTDNFSGFELFNIAPATPTDSLLVGSIDAGHLSASSGRIPLLVVLSDQVAPVLLQLHGARVEADVTGTNISTGRLGGGIREEQVSTDILPALQQMFAITVAADCVGTTCTPSSDGFNLLALFDMDMDGAITVAELEASPLIMSLFAPDIDLFDAEGFLNPNQDGVKDSLSFGVGFSAVGAVFTPPAP